MNYFFTQELVKKISQHCLLPNNQRLLISNSISKTLHLKPLVTKAQASISKTPRRSAVLIPLCTQNGVASILFTVRSNKVSTHKGQVSFPGGHWDEEDDSLQATALRETYEELGNNIGEIEIIGECQTIPAITGTLVTPIIGYLKKDIANFENFTKSENEVEDIFACPLHVLLDKDYKEYETLVRNNVETVLPVFGAKQKRHPRIWGLTGAILDGFLERGIKPALEKIQKESSSTISSSGSSTSTSSNSSSTTASAASASI